MHEQACLKDNARKREGRIRPDRGQASGQAGAAILALFLIPTGLAAAKSPPMHMTTDTREYCSHLANDITASPNPPAKALQLQAEGMDLCRQGDVIVGIRRMREALMLIRRHDQP